MVAVNGTLIDRSPTRLGSRLALGAGLLVDWLEPPARVVAGVRIGLAIVVAGTALWFLVRPLLRRVSDEAVALYLEEHEPSLEAAVLSALEARGEGGESGPAGTSDRAGPASPRRPRPSGRSAPRGPPTRSRVRPRCR